MPAVAIVRVGEIPGKTEIYQPNDLTRVLRRPVESTVDIVEKVDSLNVADFRRKLISPVKSRFFQHYRLSSPSVGEVHVP